MFSEKTSKILLWIGIILFISGIGLFLWKDFTFDYSQKIDSQKFNDFGSFIGGLIGTLWALAGVILFYVALREQREDIKINRSTLKTQVGALEQQIKEFELQRIELGLTRGVFIEQSNTLKLQQFESTFFNTLNMFHNLIESITYIKPIPQPKSLADKPVYPQQSQVYKGRDCFEFFYKEYIEEFQTLYGEYVTANLKQTFVLGVNFNIPVDIHLKISKEAYERFFKNQQSDLGHYFRTMYNLIRFVNDKKIGNPKYYTNLVRAGLSTYEHLMLFYNAISKYGEERFKPLIIDYSMLDNMAKELLLDQKHLEFYPEKAYK